MKNYRILIVYKFQNKYNITFFKTIIFFKMRAPFQSKQRGYFFWGWSSIIERILILLKLYIFGLFVSGAAWVQCTGTLDPLRLCIGLVEILTRVQKLNTCQDRNRSSALVHWTQSFPVDGERHGSSVQEHWTH